MNLAAIALEKRAVTYFFVFLLAVGGVASFLQLGQLEDPAFTVKTAVVVTEYPGASPEEVELEVTNRIEKAIQELPQLDDIYSISREGVSVITVDIKQEYWSDRLPQVWDEMRKKIRDIVPQLPPGAGEPDVSDDFNFVYGFVLAVTGDGFTEQELDDSVDALKKDLALVPGVSRAELWGTPTRVVYVDASQAQLSELGLTPVNVAATLAQQNMVLDAGSVDVAGVRVRVAPTGAFTSPEDIGDLVIRGTTLEGIMSASVAPGVGTTSAAELSEARRAAASTGDLIRIRDIATVRRGSLEPPPWIMRLNGQDAQAIYLANVAGGNIVDTGRALDQRLDELVRDLPIGIEVHKIAWQSDLVTEAINAFMVNLGEAIAIVLVVLTLAMGWRMGVIIGSALVFTILGTFLVMFIAGIDLQRMSLGALVIALGMMVDNAIVVSDGIYTRLQKGMEPTQAAIDSAAGAAWPLLGATIVAVMAFYPIFASQADAGEYCRTLFSVVAVSLVLSWLIAMTLTPVQCVDMLKVEQKEGDEDPYGGAMYLRFRGLLAGAIRARFAFIGGMVALLVVAVISFGGVRQMFFPDAARAQLMIDYWAPQGTRIQEVSEELQPLEARLLASDHVADVAAFIGQGPPRFYLPVDPEMAYPEYAELVVNTHEPADVDALIAEIEPWMRDNVPNALVRTRRYGVGPADTWKFEARFSGPANADLGTLRRIGAEGMAILEAMPLATDVRIDMRQRTRKLVPDYEQARARWAFVSRDDVARSTKRAFDGTAVGLYREGEDLYPILFRQVEEERERVSADFDALQVQSAMQVDTVPLSALTRGIDYAWEDPIIVRWQRRRAITVQASPRGVTFPTLRESVIAQFNAIDLPPGYEVFWDGEYDSTAVAQASLLPGLVPAGVLILFIMVALFNAFRPPVIILLTIPFVMIGITAGLLATGTPFGFVALLGAMSLAGMMIKNAIVLLDQINQEIAAGKAPYEATVDSAVSRLRPVALGAATTVLGVAPLIQDVFWISMSITIMAGLSFGTLLTMVLVPVLYTTLHNVPAPDSTG